MIRRVRDDDCAYSRELLALGRGFKLSPEPDGGRPNGTRGFAYFPPPRRGAEWAVGEWFLRFQPLIETRHVGVTRRLIPTSKRFLGGSWRQVEILPGAPLQAVGSPLSAQLGTLALTHGSHPAGGVDTLPAFRVQARPHPRPLGFLSRQRGVPAARRGDRGRGAGGTLHPAQA